jgi:DNA modification methylase
MLILKMFKDNRSVCDPFMGSGTTIKAAKELGMDYIGIDKDEFWCGEV